MQANVAASPPIDPEELTAALARAAAERLVAYPTADPTLWTCKSYHITITGRRLTDVECDCADAIFRGRICKHAVCVIFARKHGIRPVRPATYTCLGCSSTQVPDAESYCQACTLRPLTAPAVAAAEAIVAAHTSSKHDFLTLHDIHTGERLCDGCGISPVHEPFRYCTDCAKPAPFDASYELPTRFQAVRAGLR